MNEQERIVSMSPYVAKQILLARDALVNNDVCEAYHNLYLIASPNVDKMSWEVWKEIEDQATNSLTPTPPPAEGEGK